MMHLKANWLMAIPAAVLSLCILIACQAQSQSRTFSQTTAAPAIIHAAANPLKADPRASVPPQSPCISPSSARIAANLLLGNPSNATTNPQNKNNFLLVHPYYTLSYNNAAGEPNWVSWEVTKNDLGDAARRRFFATDETLPAGFNRIDTHQYSYSGFDRGHQCPHSDRAANRTMSYATFTMTNIVPQAPSLNRKAWDTFENYLRTFVEKDNDHVYDICGGAGIGGWGSKGFQTTIAGGKVKVPAMCWKIAVIVPPGEGSDLSRINANTRVIAVIMPNDDSLTFACQQYLTSVDQIEKVTGLKFFTALPPSVAAALKKKIDTAHIPDPVIEHHDSE